MHHQRTFGWGSPSASFSSRRAVGSPAEATPETAARRTAQCGSLSSLDRASANEIKKTAIEEGMLTLRRDALEKLKRGLTTVEEVLKETAADKL